MERILLQKLFSKEDLHMEKKCPKCGGNMAEGHPFAGFPIEEMVKSYICTKCHYIEMYQK